MMKFCIILKTLGGNMKLKKNKIILMTKASIYENNMFPKDRDEGNFFKYDYILKNNILNVFFVTLITGIWIILYRASSVLSQELFFEIDLLIEIFKQSIWIIVFIDIIFFIIGIFVFGKKYDILEKRMDEYYSQLEKINGTESE